MALAEHPANGPSDERIDHAESWLDLHGVTDDAATGIVAQSAFVPPDAEPPTGRGLTEATPVRQWHQFDSVAVEWDDSE